MKKVIITEENRKDVNNFIDFVGGIENAAIIINISKESLLRYSNGNVNYISQKIWNEKILSVLNAKDNIFNIIAKRIKAIENEKHKTDKRYKKILNKNQQKQNKINSLDLSEIFKNPIMRLDINIYDFEEVVDSLKNHLTQLRKNENYSKYIIIHEMAHFAHLYNIFRPNIITKNDPYYGTVTKIENIYFTLYKLFDSELLTSFSKGFNDSNIEYKNFRKIEHKDIIWDNLIKDIEYICRRIKITAQLEALKLFAKIGFDSPYIVYQLIGDIVIRFNPNTKRDAIKFDSELKVLSIDNKIIEYTKFSSLFKSILHLTD